jgi:YHS domain-containing protein
MLTKTLSILVVSLALLGGASAQSKKAAPKTVTCPICHMALATKMSKANPVAVKLTKKGKTYYCCAGCKMPASMLVKGKKPASFFDPLGSLPAVSGKILRRK